MITEIIGDRQYTIIRYTVDTYKVIIENPQHLEFIIEASYDDISRLICCLDSVRMSLPYKTIEAKKNNICMKCGKKVSNDSINTFDYDYGHRECFLDKI